MAASRLAQDIHLRLLAEGVITNPQDEPLGPVIARREAAIDTELQEVREALPLLATKCYASFKNEFCWCHRPTRATRPDGDTHDTTCQRARALLSKLTVPSEGKEIL